MTQPTYEITQPMFDDHDARVRCLKCGTTKHGTNNPDTIAEYMRIHSRECQDSTPTPPLPKGPTDDAQRRSGVMTWRA